MRASCRLWLDDCERRLVSQYWCDYSLWNRPCRSLMSEYITTYKGRLLLSQSQAGKTKPHHITPSRPSATQPPYLLHIRSHTNFILVTVVLAVFIDSFLYGLILPVIPLALSAQTGEPESQRQQWNSILSACFSGALFISSPFAGAYADRSSSRRAPMLGGLVALGGATVLPYVGRHIAVLALGRVLQGLSAAIVWSVGLALLADTAGPSIGLFMGYVSIALSGDLLVSPLIGGVLYETHGYYSVYSVAFALIVLDIVLRLLMIEKRHAAQWLPEVVEDSAGEQSDSDASSASDAAGEQEKKKIGVTATTAAAAPAQLDAAPKAGLANHRYVRLIKSPRMLAALTGVAVHAAVIVSLEVTVPLFVKNTYGWNSTAAGLVLLASMLPSLLSPVISAISDKYGAKWPSFIGFLLSIPVLVCLRFAEIDSTLAQKVTLVALLTVLGITMGTADSPLMAEITYAIQDAEAADPGMWGEKGVYGAAVIWTLYHLLRARGDLGSLMGGYLVSGVG
ncbi:hypothetical protein RB594_002167 [Gaeumannomyces avenae]